MIRMIRVPKAILPLIANYTQKQVKLVLLMLRGYQNGQLKQRVSGESMRNAFGWESNISDIQKKLTASLRDKEALFGYIMTQYPSNIEYAFSTDFEIVLESADTECIEFNEALLAGLPNTGYSLKLLLLLLSSAKNGSCTVPIADAGVLLFGGQTAYTPNKANATANQLARLNQAVEDINACTNYAVTVAPIKERRAVSAWHFTMTTTAVRDTVSPQVILQLLQKYNFNVSDASANFIALFCTNESDAASMVRNIAKEAAMLTRAGIMDSGDIPKFVNRKAALYPHANPVLWYTTSIVQRVLEHLIYKYPLQFAWYITGIVHNCHSYRDMLRFMKQEHIK